MQVMVFHVRNVYGRVGSSSLISGNTNSQNWRCC